MRRLTQLSPKRNEKREHSSVGSERLPYPYKQRVGGSTPSAPTTRKGIFKSSCRNVTAFLLYPAAVSGDPQPGKQNLIIRKKNIPVRKACMQGKFRKFGTDGQHDSGQAVQACCAFAL